MSATPIWPVRLRLPLPPSENHLYRFTCRHGHLNVSIDHDYDAWQHIAAIDLFHQSAPIFFSGQFPDLRVQFDYYFPTARHDVDNYDKALLDALSRRMGFNDNIVYELVCRKHVDGSAPRVEIEVAPLEAEWHKPKKTRKRVKQEASPSSTSLPKTSERRSKRATEKPTTGSGPTTSENGSASGVRRRASRNR